MVAEPSIWVDVESAVRDWARNAVASVNRRVFFGFNDKAAMPQVVVFRIAGPDDRVLIQFDVWAHTKALAAATAAELATAADGLGRSVHGGVVLLGANVEGSRWQPDEQSDKPRYVVDVTFTAVAAPAT